MAQKSLLVRVIEAKNLLAADKGGTSDPYCKVRVGANVQKTKTVKRCLNPKFEETFRFGISNPQTAKVVVEVYDKDSWSKDDPLGSVSVSLTSLEKGVEQVKLYNLTGVPKGQVKLGLKAVDFGAAPGTKEPQTGKAPTFSSNYANPAAQTGTSAYPSTYASQQPSAYQQAPSPYPQQQQQAPPPYQQPGAPAAYPQQQQQQPAPGGYPQQQQPAPGYPQQQQAAGGYPQQQQQQYPQQSAPGGYPQQPAPGGYPQQPAPGGYPQQQPGIPGIPSIPQIPGAFPGAPGGYPQYPPAGGYPPQQQQPGGYPQQPPSGYPQQQQQQQQQGYPQGGAGAYPSYPAAQ